MADDFVTICTYPTLPAAEAARLHLEAAGIRVFLVDAETIGMDWLLGTALGHIKLQVPRDQARAARAALAAETGNPRERKKQRRRRARDRGKKARKPAGAETCLACGAALPPSQPRCRSCGWSYLGEDEEAVSEGASASGGSETQAGEARAMETLRSFKRPVLWLILGPILGMLVLGLLGMLALVLLKLIATP